MNVVKVEGKNKKHRVKAYTISTCGWCKKMKRLLKSLEVEYEYVDIDLLSPEDENHLWDELKKFNPKIVTPLVIVDDGAEVILGYDKKKVEQVFADG